MDLPMFTLYKGGMILGVYREVERYASMILREEIWDHFPFVNFANLAKITKINIVSYVVVLQFSF